MTGSVPGQRRARHPVADPSQRDAGRLDRVSQELLAGITAGERVDWRSRPDEDRTVNADCINRHLQDRTASRSPLDIRGVVVRGRIVVRNRVLPRQVIMTDCLFEEIELDRVRLECLDLEGSTMAGLTCRRLVVSGDLLMRDCVIHEGVVVAGARIKGMMSLTGASVGTSQKQAVALDADGLEVGRALHLDHGFRAVGEVQLRGATIKACLYCSAGHFEATSLGSLSADGIVVKEEVFLNDGFRASGPVRLNNARIGRHLNCTDGIFEGAGGQGPALEVQYAHVSGDVYLNALDDSGKRFSATGRVDLNHARIGQRVCCAGGVFTHSHDRALVLDGIAVGGDLLLGAVVRGEVSIAGSTVTGDVDCRQAQLRDPIPGDRRVAEVSLRLNDSTVDGYVRLGDGFTSHGAVVLDDARVTCGVDCCDGEFLARSGDMLFSARGMSVEHSFTWSPKKCHEGGVVDLVGARVGCLRDYSEVQDDDPWSQLSVRLRGFTFGHILNLGDTRKRGRWLRNTDVYTPEVYDQVATEYLAVGRERDARQVRYWGAREEHAMLWHAHRPSWVLRWIPRLTVGYWYKPLRLFVPLGVLVALAWILFSCAQAAGAMAPVGNDPNGPAFYPLAYTLEHLIPYVKIHQAEYWRPDPGRQGWTRALGTVIWSLSIAGWIIVAVVTERVVKPLLRK